MKKEKERQRILSLFTDIEKLAADPAGITPQAQREIEALRARLVELEKQLMDRENNDHAPIASGNSAQVMLYEKDQVGYMFSDGKFEPVQDSSRILPNIKDGISSPLTINGQTVGTMQIETPSQHQWTAEETRLANAIAQQASLQIQNLRLLEATERSRTEAETATRRFMREGWEAYLDAINQNERVGFAYDQAALIPYTDAPKSNGGVKEPVNLTNEQVGTVYLKPDPNHPLKDADKALISKVATQIAQQVENIRLLADASRARAEAEEATRLLTRQNWENYTEKEETVTGFVYDSNRVTPLVNETIATAVDLAQSLMVRGEPIGQLTVSGLSDISQEAKDIAAAIAAQTSIHLETLRLSEELQKRARELEELDRLKSAFLANMSHELRTPLNSILGFTDVMLEGLDGDLTNYMDNDLRLIQKNGRHLLHLINDVLDMAKIESGRMNLHPETFKVHDLLEEVASITAPLASEKNLSLYIDEESDNSVEVFADNTRLRQVMINLVNNSIKFTEKGGIGLCVKPIDGARVLISVKDTGIGIPPDHLEKIFQEFTQVDTSTTRKAGGTGLGLPISRRLIEMHGGRLWAESTGIEGEGSTLFVELPTEAHIADVIEKQEK